MNKERMLELADKIEATPHATGKWNPMAPRGPLQGFNMQFFSAPRDGCGTAGCIAGWAAELYREDSQEFEVATVSRVFDIPHAEAHDLCYPSSATPGWGKLTPSMAANVLRAMAHGCSARTAWYNISRSEASDE